MSSKLLALSGWPRICALFLCGAGAALSLAPFHIWPLLFISYGGLFLYLLRADGAKQAFKIGWWWGFGFFLVGMYWISISLLVDPNFLWLLPFSLIGLNGGFALFTATSCLLFFFIKRQQPIFNTILFSLCLFAGEWLRGHILTGFPWNVIGYVWGASNETSQIAHPLNIYALTFLAIYIATLPAITLISNKKTRITAPLTSLLAIALAFGYGSDRLRANTDPAFTETTIQIVQPNINQATKWEPEQAAAIMQRLTSLSVQNDKNPSDIIIWPETAVPYTLLASSTSLSSLKDIIPPETQLITGIVTSNGNRAAPKLWNSLISLDDKAHITHRYDKHHLVPFGEYMPLRQWIPANKLTAGTIDFSSGAPMISTQPTGNMPAFLPLICYEIIFPNYTQNTENADWILNITNDDWFGNSSGPYQHLEAARFRAIESGLPVVRVANSGISAIIDPYGRIIGRIALDIRGTITQKLPKPIK